MKIINLTPHDIVIRSDESNELAILESDRVFKSAGRGFITTKAETSLDAVDGIPCVQIEYGEIEGLAEPTADTIFIVSMPTAQYLAAQGRSEDIRYPDTGKPQFCVRTEKGLPFATRRLLKAKVR